MEGTQQTPHIVILPSPGMGHLIPLAEFAKKLVLHHDFAITLAIPIDGSASKNQKAFVDALPRTINSMFLPPVDLKNDLSEDVMIETRICLTMTRSLPSLRETFKVFTNTTRLVALVVDLFGTDAFDVAREFNVLPYIFFPSTSMFLSFLLYLPKLDEMYSCEYRDMPEPVKLPGCIPVHGTDFLDPVQDRKNEAYSWMLHQSKRFHLAEGIMLNSFMALEPGAIKALTEEGDLTRKPPVYMVGPLIQNLSRDDIVHGSECLRWLDDQPPDSVIFVSFGSAGVLSKEQLTELALGLELSEQRFLWVARTPTQKAANAAFFSSHSSEDPLAFLPDGFLERSKERGLVVHSWAPQIQVLSHGSTGGFLTHCGWNSTLESVVHGVPMVAWPLYAEQKMNAVMLVEDIKMALRPKTEEINGLICRDEIAAVLKCLMEGEEGKRVRNKMKELKDAAAKALSKDGSSTESLSEVACKWKTHAAI